MKNVRVTFIPSAGALEEIFVTIPENSKIYDLKQAVAEMMGCETYLVCSDLERADASSSRQK
jgi:hypothetical protein